MGYFFFVLIVLVAGVLLVRQGYKKSQAEAANDAKLAQIFHRYDMYASPADKSLIAINFDEKKLGLGTKYNAKKYDFSQIASVEVIQNGATVTQTNRGSQALGAAVGTLIAGPIGALVGSMTGSSRTRERLHGLSLKLIVDDRTHPTHTICFLKALTTKGLKLDDPEAKSARDRIDRFHGHLVNAMREVQLTQQKSSVFVAYSPITDVSAQLERLWELKQKGALSNSEFSSQKARLLGNSDGDIPSLPPPPAA